MFDRRNVMTAAGLAALCGFGPVRAQAPRTISYALPSKSLVSAAPLIAEQLGLFARHGLQPQFAYIESTAQTAMSVMSRSVQFGETATAEVITASAKGQALVVVANHYRGLAGSLVLSKAAAAKLAVSADAPPADRLKALDNLVLASVSRISSLTIAYKTAANGAGGQPRFTYMGVSAMGAALEAGAVDGIIATAPYWAFPVTKGTGLLWLNPARGDLPAAVMPSTSSATVVSREFANANPDLVRAVAAVFDDLSTAVAQRPAEVRSVVAKLYPDLPPQTLELIYALEGPAFATRPLTPADMEHDIRYLRNSGGDYGPIDKVNPASLLLQR